MKNNATTGGGVEPNVVVYNAAIASFVQAVNRLDAADEDPGVGFSREDSLGDGASKRGEERSRSWRSA